MARSEFLSEFAFGNWDTNNFCNTLAETEYSGNLEGMVVRALVPAARTDKIIEAWMTPAFVLAWDLITWLEGIVAEWCRSHLPHGDPCGWFHLVDNLVERDEPPEGDTDHNILLTALIAGAALEIDFDAVAAVLLTDAHWQDVMHTSFRELSRVRPGRWAALASLPNRPKREQPRGEDGALTTEGIMYFAVEERFREREREREELPGESPGEQAIRFPSPD
jgi:hypothetical protein